MAKIYLLNDTSREHVGSKACSAVIRTLLSLRYKIIGIHLAGDIVSPKLLDQADEIVVNGEGTLHHNRPRAILLLKAMEQAIALGKPTHLINAVWQDMDNIWGNVLSQLKTVIVRDPISKEEMALHGINARLYPDCAILAKPSVTLAKVPFRNNIVVGDRTGDDKSKTSIFRHKLLSGYDKYPIPQNNWNDYVTSLKTARIYITGRHHGIYACILARTPFIPLKSNSHKIEGLLRFNNPAIPLLTEPEQLVEYIEFVSAHPEVYDNFFDYMDDLPVWDGRLGDDLNVWDGRTL